MTHSETQPRRLNVGRNEQRTPGLQRRVPPGPRSAERHDPAYALDQRNLRRARLALLTFGAAALLGVGVVLNDLRAQERPFQATVLRLREVPLASGRGVRFSLDTDAGELGIAESMVGAAGEGRTVCGVLRLGRTSGGQERRIVQRLTPCRP